MNPHLTLAILLLLAGCRSTHFISADANKPIDLPDSGLPMEPGSVAVVGHFSTVTSGHNDVYYERGRPTGSPADKRRDYEYLVARTQAGVGFRHQVEPLVMVGAGLSGSFIQSRFQSGASAAVERLTLYIENSIYSDHSRSAASAYLSIHGLLGASLVSHEFTLFTRDSFFMPIVDNADSGIEPRLIYEFFLEAPLYFPAGSAIGLTFAPQFRYVFSQSILHQRAGFQTSVTWHPSRRFRVQAGYGFISKSWVVGDYWGNMVGPDDRRTFSSAFQNLNVTVQYVLRP
jgi:hypothetical protein